MADSLNDQVNKKDLGELEQKLLEQLVNKEEFQQAVTKEEFQREVSKFATKEELIQVREELLERLAAKAGLEVVANQVARNTLDIIDMKKNIKGIKREMGQMREDIGSINSKFDILITAVDGIGKEF